MRIEAFDLEELKEEMKTNNINHLSELDNVGFITLSNYGGITILINSSGDGLFYQYYNNDIDIAEIKTFFAEDVEDADLYNLPDQGFKIDDQVYLLQEFMRKEV